MRRAAVSIPSNIAEGAARQTNKEFIQFLYIALGSCAELDTQCILAKNLRYMGECPELTNSIEAVAKMLNGLVRHLKSRES
jgi:four helix bundle protein